MPGKMARSDPRADVRVTRGAGSSQHLASVLQEGRENANIDAGLGFIWRISARDATRRGGRPFRIPRVASQATPERRGDSVTLDLDSAARSGVSIGKLSPRLNLESVII